MTSSFRRSSVLINAVFASLAIAPHALAVEPHPDGDEPWTLSAEPAGPASSWPGEGVSARNGRFAFDRSPAARNAVPPFIFTGDLPEGDAPADAVFTPDGDTIVVAHRESSNLILWNADTRTFEGEVPISGLPQAIAITPDGTTAIVANIDDSVSFVDLAAQAEVAVVPLAQNPGVVAVSPAGDIAAVGLTFSAEIVVFDIATRSVLRTIPGIGYSQIQTGNAEPPASGISFSRFEFIDDDRIVNVDRFGGRGVQFIDARTGAVNNVAVAANPAGYDVSGDASTAVVAHAGTTRTITVVDLATESVLRTFPTSDNLSGPIGTNLDGSVAIAGILNAARRYDTLTGAASPAQSTSSFSQILVTPDQQHALCVGFRGAVVSFATGLQVDQVNNVASTSFGAMAPAEPRAAMFSTTFGDDMVVVNADGASGFLEQVLLSGPAIEGDRCRTVAVTPDGSTVVGVSIFSDNASIVDASTASVIGTAPLGQRPSAVATTPDGTRAVVGNLDSAFATVVDLATASSVNVPISRRAGSVAISPDSRFAYLGVLADGDGVWRIDLDTNSVLGPKILTGNMGGVGYSFSQSSQIALSPDGALLAVAGTFTDNVSIIDTATWSLLVNVPVGDFPTWFGFSPDSERLFVANKNDDTLSEIDTTLAVPAVVRTLAAGDQPWQTVVTDDAVYVHAWAAAQIRRIDRSTGATTAIRSLPETGVGLLRDASSGQLVVARGVATTSTGGIEGFLRTQAGTLEFLDPVTLAVTGTVDLGDRGPSAVAISDSGSTIAIAAPLGDGLVVIFDDTCFADVTTTGLPNGVPDGVVDLSDFSFYLTLWSSQDAAADITTSGACNPGTGGDGVDLSDFSCYLSEWSIGCP